MIKRLFKIAQAEFNDYRLKNKRDEKDFPPEEPAYQEPVVSAPDPLAQYYANLEIPVGSDRATVKKAWKTQMKKYHPDLHCADPEKKRIAEELTLQLTEAHRILDTALSKNVRGENNGRF
jgi:DnaJ-domain-containing protein 1